MRRWKTFITKTSIILLNSFCINFHQWFLAKISNVILHFRFYRILKLPRQQSRLLFKLRILRPKGNSIISNQFRRTSHFPACKVLNKIKHSSCTSWNASTSSRVVQINTQVFAVNADVRIDKVLEADVGEWSHSVLHKCFACFCCLVYRKEMNISFEREWRVSRSV